MGGSVCVNTAALDVGVSNPCRVGSSLCAPIVAAGVPYVGSVMRTFIPRVWRSSGRECSILCCTVEGRLLSCCSPTNLANASRNFPMAKSEVDTDGEPMYVIRVARHWIRNCGVLCDDDTCQGHDPLWCPFAWKRSILKTARRDRLWACAGHGHDPLWAFLTGSAPFKKPHVTIVYGLSMVAVTIVYATKGNKA